jgi:hypothetical protein
MNEYLAINLWNENRYTTHGVAGDEPIQSMNSLGGASAMMCPRGGYIRSHGDAIGKQEAASFLRDWADALDPQPTPEATP